ncbi:E3 ubiquitin-protein ligase [Wickerhamomyces ciferrii]|uniref:HECT-type E3 ubiquitin transferase n=1 Tax=Wickerhamomyces ciferrii (strain ATCC 14091 / BCRC 22168 / CBS 111 / JCM 3599 / NBRC 0793 / NRRL Y-1031 F-60-10) TaxID=1206466 RepID=K0KLU8_WICCF|nr:E3 ubiquitin-protein ligase [Wickerhamomyces ciferrii]CCH43971.1 E3 ubiquitin-protein ligase [Wickerhamomyces ciferrii]
MLITKRQEKSIQDISKPLESIIKSIKDASNDELPKVLRANLTWDTSKGTLLTWIDILNKFDSILESVVNKYKLGEEQAKLVVMDNKDTELVVSILDFTYMLLDNSSHKSAYSSSHRLYDLLQSPTIPVIKAVLRCFVILGKKYSIKSMRRGFVATRKVSDRVYPLALLLPASTVATSTTNEENRSLIDFIKETAVVPKKWRNIEHTYFPETEYKESVHTEPSPVQNSPSVKKVRNQQQQQISPTKGKKQQQQKGSDKDQKNGGGAAVYYLPESEIRKLSLEQIFDKGVERLPSKTWYKFALKAIMTKSFNTNSYENIKLRQDLVIIKLLAISLLVSVNSEFEVTSRIFEADPNLLQSAIELTNLQNPVPLEIRMAAVISLDCISSLKTWSTEILKSYGGSISHGLLLQNVRYIIKQIKNKDTNIDEDFNTYYLTVISNLAEVKSLGATLVSAGLIQTLTEFLHLETDYKKTVAGATHLLNTVISTSSDYVTLFRELNGFNTLIGIIGYEIEFALNNPGYGGGPPKITAVHYSISFKQANLIRSFLKFAHSLIQSESGDRVRNLFDSPLLGHLNNILQNTNVFGYTLLTLAINTISAIIHNEPTSYGILKEANTIDLIVDNFEKYFGKSSELITALPNVIGAIALNTEGLQRVKESNLIHKLFKIFDNNDYAKALVVDDASDYFGSTIDELARHYPDLKPIIINEVAELIKKLPGFAKSHLPTPKIYKSEAGSFYHSKEDEVVDNEEGSNQIDAWETLDEAYIVENAMVFIGNLIQYSNAWITIMDKLPFEDWLPLLTLPNSSYDYVYSNSMYPVNGILKYFDDERREYAPRILISEIHKQVSSFKDYIASNESKSLFQVYDGNAEKSDDLLNRMISVNNILFAFVDVYCNQTTLSPTRVGQLARFFSDKEGLELLELLGQLLKRVTYEEEVIRSTLPEITSKETIPNIADEGIPPLRIVAGKEKPQPVFNKTSAKFKNTLQVRFLGNRIHGSIAVIFNTLLSLTNSGRQETTVDSYRGFSVLVTTTVTKILSDYLVLDTSLTASYQLVLIDTISYALMDASSGKILTLPAITFMQNEGFIRQRDILLHIWPQLGNLTETQIKELTEAKHTIDTSESIVLEIVTHILDLFNLITNFELLTSVSNGPLYYEGDLQGAVNLPVHNLSVSFLTQSKLLGFGALSGILDEDQFASIDEGVKLPPSVVSGLIKLGKQLYSTAGEKNLNYTDGSLYKLDWKQAKDSHNRVEYLQSLGLSEEVSLRIVNQHGGDLTVLEEENLPEGLGSPDEWKTAVEKSKELKYNRPTPVLVLPQYADKHTLTDLEEARQSKSDYLLDQFLLIAQVYPETVQSVSEFLLSSFLGSSKHNVVNFEANILRTVLDYIYSFEIKNENSQELSSMLKLFGLLLENDTVYFGASSTMKNFASFIIESLKPEFADCDWFSEAIFALHRIITVTLLPDYEKVDKDIAFALPKPPQITFELEPTLRDDLFKILISVKDLTKFKSALAVTRALLIFSRNPERSKEILKSNLIQLIVKVISKSKYSEDEKPYSLELAFSLLVRSCYETKDVILSLIQREINRQFTSKSRSDNSKEKIRDLVSLVKDHAGVILRFPELYIDELSKNTRFNDFSIPLRNLNVRYHQEKEEDVPMVDAVTGNKDVNEKSTTLDDQTGIVHLLLTELMTTAKKDWTTEPPLSEKELEEQRKEKEKNEMPKAPKVDVNKNENCRYMLYLLKVIVELLASYKQSKLEFLTFSKKQLFQTEADNDIFKPRSTSLNFFLHQLIQGSVTDLTKPEDIRKRAVSELASKAIVAFISSIDQSDLKADAKKVDPDMTFIRKFTVDSILKVVKDVTLSSQTMNVRYKKLISVNKIIPSLLSTSREKLVEEGTVEFDGFHMAKSMIDASIPQALTGVLTEIDVNYPEYYFVLDSIVTSLQVISSAKSKFQDLFKEYLPNTGADEEELEEDENDFKEETPDLFRNSTLGMYDVDEIDSEEDMSDYDDDFDEDDPDRSLEIVYSEDDDEEDEDNDEELIDSDGEEVAEVEDADEINEHGFEDFEMEDDMSESEDSGSGSESGYSDDDEHMEDGSDVELIADYDHSGVSDDESEEPRAHRNSAGRFIDVLAEQSDLESELDEMVGDDEDGVDLGSSSPSGNHLHEGNGNLGLFLDADDDDSNESDLDSDENDLDPFSALLSNPRTHRRSARPHDHNIRPARVVINAQDLGSLDPASIRESIQRATANLTSQQMRGMPDLGQFESLLNRESLRRVLHPGGVLNRSSESEMTLKSTKERWNELNTLFFGKSPQSLRVIPSIINRIFDPSEQLFHKKKAEEDERRKKEEEELKKKKEEEETKRKEEEAERRASRAAAEDDEMEVQDAHNEEREPIYVMIGDRQVDIAGTDIDPEFFEALPDDMREEVFTQHVRERRAQATDLGTGSREIDQDFLEALPDAIREEILAHEAINARVAPVMESLNANANRAQEATGETTERTDEPAARTGKQKTFFTPLVDRFGIASLIRFVFVPQSFQGRRSLYDLLGKICINKQSRAEVLGYLIAILQDGINDQQSLEKTFHQICSRAKNTTINLNTGSSAKPSTPRTPNTPQAKGNTALNHFPIRATPFIVSGQVLEALQYLLESDPHLRYYFLSEHEPIILAKKSLSAKFKKELLGKHSKYPLNSLLSLLDRSLVKEKSVLMDLLSRIIQITTRPLNALKKAQNEKAKSSDENNEKQKKNIDLPSVADSSFSNVVTILTSDDCSSRTFQQTLSAMQNLLVVDSSHNIFASELSDYASKLGRVIISNISALVDELKAYTVNDLDAELMSKFTSSSSDQSKLLRVLTALDYLFGKLEENDTNLKELTDLYKKLALGPLWGALSDCLYLLEENKNITHTATALLPLIEALMVVCKHSKVKELQAKDAIKYENKKCDFANEPIESLFFSFTDTHKKILNQMVRSNPKLMSGPFSMLVRNPRVLEFDNKKNYFDRKLHSNENEKQTLAVSIRRDQVFLDSYRALFFKSKDEFRNAKLDISFKGEAGVDAGGVTREWFQVLSRQMFNADYALFLPVASDKTTFHPNRTSWVNPEHLSFFKFIGRIIGKAIYDNCFLDCHFSRDVYKSILGRIVSLKDLETIDLEYFNSLMWMLNNDITDIIIETFAVETDDYGAVQTVDLIPGGRDIPVTEENKQDYVRLVVEYRLQKSVQEQMDNFLQGFHEIIPKELISIFDEQELELLISGLPDIDVDDWKNNTTYVNYSPSSKEISYFWRAVRSFDAEERAKLLQFATGTSKVPLNGFKELGGSGDNSKFSIHKDFGSTERLPSSHTCFNQIDLPAYDSYETLRGSLLLAITEGHEGFGLA